jgi:hypothetical protein
MSRTNELAHCLGHAFLAAWLLFHCGCSVGPEFGKVAGKVVIPGHTADDLRIEFHPDATAGTTGPSSTGETDDQGNFLLSSATEAGVQEGAVVGMHRVVLQDLRLAQSETGRGIPQRIRREHAEVLSTPLVVEVKAGEQTIVLDLGK